MAQRCNQLAGLHGAWCRTSDVWFENSSHFSVAWICVGAGKLVSPPLLQWIFLGGISLVQWILILGVLQLREHYGGVCVLVNMCVMCECVCVCEHMYVFVW